MPRKRMNPLPTKVTDNMPEEVDVIVRPNSFAEAANALLEIMEELGAPIEDDPHVSS